jgi:hypothetical protein
MSKTAYAARLEPYIHELPTATKNALLLKIALLVFPDGTDQEPSSPSAFYEEFRKLLAKFNPDEHLGFDREALTRELGNYVVEWWGEAHEPPLTGRELDHLLGALPDTGVREALARFASERRDREG